MVAARGLKGGGAVGVATSKRALNNASPVASRERRPQSAERPCHTALRLCVALLTTDCVPLARSLVVRSLPVRPGVAVRLSGRCSSVRLRMHG